MAAPLSIVLAQALELSEQDRGELAMELLRSLGPEDGAEVSGPEWEAAWTEELDRRLEEVRNGTADLVDGDVVHAEVRALLAARRP